MAVALGKDALGLEQKRLAEALGSDDHELVIAPRSQECIDLGGSVEQRLVEILRYADVIGVNSPSPHAECPRGERLERVNWTKLSVVPSYCALGRQRMAHLDQNLCPSKNADTRSAFWRGLESATNPSSALHPSDTR